MLLLLTLACWALPAAGAPAPEEREGPVDIDLGKTPFTVSGGLRAFTPTSASAGTMTVSLRGSMLGAPGKWGELLFDVRRTALAGRRFGNSARVAAELRVSPPFVGDGKRNWHRAHRARLFLEDARRRRMYLPNHAIVDRPKSSDGWLPLAGRVTVDVPMPLGHADDGFDPARVTGVGVNVEAFNREGEVVQGSIELRGLRVAFTPAIRARVLAADPALRAGEAARAARMQVRLGERCGVGPREMAVGVNLAWPAVRTPDGKEMQLYGRILDAGASRWWGRLFDVGDEAVAASVRGDFRGIRETFGPGAPVRLWLFADGRTGLVFDEHGELTGVSDRARANMAVLLRLAAEERVVLVPVLLDFGIADGVAHSGPDGAWPVGEHPELITDAARRARLVAALESFVRPYADHPAVLAWDVMNEPGNAAAVVTPEHFADLQTLVRDLVDAVHRAGGLATVGHRNVPDPRRFWRGRVASDLGQVHHYPFVETRPNPVPFGTALGPTFGPLPAGWGELQAMPGDILGQLQTARRAGHRLFMFWSWRGHEETGDGFAVVPYAEEIRAALARLRGR
jgi:hypothetical protein